MAWCTNCEQNREIEHRIRGESTAVPTRTQRYNRDGDRIGYEEGAAYETTIDSIPVCRWCNTRFEFPRAQSKEQYFNAKKELAIRRWRAQKPSKEFEDDDDYWSSKYEWLGYVGLFAIAGVFLIGGPTENVLLGLGAGVLIGVVVYVLRRLLGGKKEKVEKKAPTLTPKMQAWQEELRRWETMPYTETNYQHLRDWRP